MEKHIYTSIRTFGFYDYSPGHSRLLIRSSKGLNNLTIDIIFEGVEYIDIATLLYGITIIKYYPENNSNSFFLKNNFPFVYKIISQSDIFHIRSVNLSIFENKLDFLESSLFVDDSNIGNRILKDF